MAAQWTGIPSIKGSTDSLRMALLTVSLTGVQLVWGVEMAYCAPYLLSLGLTKSRMSLVWNVGPLSGLITQPIVGVLADRSRSRWGRRRPVMMIGSIAVALALLVLGWTREIVGLFFDGETAKTMTIVLAVLAIYLVDFAVNAVQACCRALIVDTLPIPQQQHGSAWASRMIAIGNIAGYFAGMVDLIGIFGKTLGDSQFKQLLVISAFLLVFCVSITCFCVTERVLLTRRSNDKSGVLHVFRLIWKTLWNLPVGIWRICVVLFWAWIGWFPFMVYSTTFVGEVLKRYDTSMKEELENSKDVLGDITRIGSMALVLFSCVSLVASVILPWFVISPDSDDLHKKSLPPGSLFARFLNSIEPFKPDLSATWIFGHFTFAVLMMSTIFTGTVRFATFLVAFSGVSWALMTWAPFAIVGEEINRLSGNDGRRISRTRRANGEYIALEERDLELERNSNPMADMEGGRTSLSSAVPPFPADLDQDSTSSSDLAGIYLGILNIFACLPQFVGSFISFIVFSILEPGKSPEFSDGDDIILPPSRGVNAIAVCLGIGGLSTLVAAHYTLKLKYR